MPPQLDGVNWLIPISFGAGMCFGAILLTLVAVIYAHEWPGRREP